MNRRRQLVNLITERVVSLLQEVTLPKHIEDEIINAVYNQNDNFELNLSDEKKEDYIEFFKDAYQSFKDSTGGDIHDYSEFIHELSEEDFVNQNIDFNTDTEEDELEQLESEIDQEEEF